MIISCVNSFLTVYWRRMNDNKFCCNFKKNLYNFGKGISKYKKNELLSHSNRTVDAEWQRCILTSEINSGIYNVNIVFILIYIYHVQCTYTDVPSHSIIFLIHNVILKCRVYQSKHGWVSLKKVRLP